MVVVIGLTLILSASAMANKSSFHVSIKIRIATETKPGIDSGIITLLRIPRFEQPSIFEASTNSSGITSIKPFINHIRNGNHIYESARMRIRNVSKI
jgi:hypothetical protein